MQDRFKYRAWSKERNRYVTDKDIKDIFCNTYVKNHDLLELEDCSSYIVEQCTGLKDKNGKLICEGDIVKYHVTKKTSFPIEREVVASKTKKVTFKKGCFNPVFYLDLNDVEIIGNIHENKELLEATND